ncbi:MAG: hypothetical protein KKA79_07385 [Nanoarchaeota archaeon]|nr:hypothetical protein [Nanoarchaeota archaeon]MCG2718582.1 hypothetical protein [Nanoarchaeota archaeon]
MAVKGSKKQKKTWFNIVTPKEFGNHVIGETLAVEPQKLVGKYVKIGLMALMNDPKKQNIKMKFKIKNVTEKTATTEVIRYEVVPGYIKRMVRKGRAKVEDSFITETKDKVRIRIKPVIITRSKTQRSVLAEIRRKAKEFIIERLKSQNFSEFLNDSITTKNQRDMKDALKKLYPIAFCEFRVISKL